MFLVLGFLGFSLEPSWSSCKDIVKPAAANVDSELNCVGWLSVSSTAKIFGFGLRSGPKGM